MNFMEAIKAMKEGKKVRRSSWSNKDFNINHIKGVINGGDIGWTGMSIEKEPNPNHHFRLMDIEATDWEIYEEEDRELFDKEHNQYKGFNKYGVHGNEIFITLTKQDGEPKAISIIDKEDLEKIKHSRWVLNDNGYARGYDKEKRYVYLHQVIYGSVLEGNVLDHINQNKLDNRKSNLREVSRLGNILNRPLGKNNTSGVKGVYYNKDDNKWVAKLMLDYESKHILTFNTKEEAIEARKKAEKQYFDSDWNLADKVITIGDGITSHCMLEDIKTFIQKVKEYNIKKRNEKTTDSDYDKGFTNAMDFANLHLDKRAGEF